MTPEEITAMAEKMAICYSADSVEFTNDGLLAFAALVAEKAAARATEACAVLALDKAGTTDYDYSTCINLADAIRARGQKGGV